MKGTVSEERKHFFQGKESNEVNQDAVEFTDPLKKREEFAVSLRKQKTKAIIKEKRRKLMESFLSK